MPCPLLPESPLQDWDTHPQLPQLCSNWGVALCVKEPFLPRTGTHPEGSLQSTFASHTVRRQGSFSLLSSGWLWKAGHSSSRAPTWGLCCHYITVHLDLPTPDVLTPDQCCSEEGSPVYFLWVDLGFRICILGIIIQTMCQLTLFQHL